MQDCRWVVTIRLPAGKNTRENGQETRSGSLFSNIRFFYRGGIHLSGFVEKINASSSTAIIVSVALMLFSGFAMTRITKKLRLPNVTAYILVGIMLGPSVMNLVPSRVISGMDFLSDIALAFIAFGTGEFFRFSELKKNGARTVVITVFEALLASVLVFVICWSVLRLSLPFSLVLAALASATAPASTVMTIRQTGAKGDFVSTLLQVVALDDIVALVAYSIAIAAASSSGSENAAFRGVILPLLTNTGVVLLGGVFGFFLKLLLMPKTRSTDNRLIIALALLFALCGVCAVLDISPLLGCMSMGTVYINLTGDDKLFKQLNYFDPPILLLFFVRSGLNFRMDLLLHPSGSIGNAPLLLVGVLYFFFRIFGKYFGAFFGCMIVKKPLKIRNYLGLALIPQAGVAIGLAAIGARSLGGETGGALETIILASSVLYELVGPACAKFALWRSGSYSNKLEDLVPEAELTSLEKPKSQTELLIERIHIIQATMPPELQYHVEEENAFTEAAEAQITAVRHEIDHHSIKQRKGLR